MGGGWDCKNPHTKIGAIHPPTTFELVKIGENEVSMLSTCASFTQVMTDKLQFDSQELSKMKCDERFASQHKSQGQQFEAAKVL